MTSEKELPPSDRFSINRENFPALTAFFRGYLHQDFEEEFGSAAEAIAVFRADAGPDEWAAFMREWDLFWTLAGDLPVSRIARLMTKVLGGYWTPESHEEIQSAFSGWHDA